MNTLGAPTDFLPPQTTAERYRTLLGQTTIHVVAMAQQPTLRRRLFPLTLLRMLDIVVSQVASDDESAIEERLAQYCNLNGLSQEVAQILVHTAQEMGWCDVTE